MCLHSNRYSHGSSSSIQSTTLIATGPAMFVDNLSEAAKPILKAKKQRKESIGVQEMDPEIRATVQRMAPDTARSPKEEWVHATVPAPITRAAVHGADKGRAQVVEAAADNRQRQRISNPG